MGIFVYWKEILAGIVVVALGTLAFVFHMELVSAQAKLATCRAQSIVLSSTIGNQNKEIKALNQKQKQLDAKMKSAHEKVIHIRVFTAPKYHQIVKTPIGPSCPNAMNFLRKEEVQFKGK